MLEHTPHFDRPDADTNSPDLAGHDLPLPPLGPTSPPVVTETPGPVPDAVAAVASDKPRPVIQEQVERPELDTLPDADADQAPASPEVIRYEIALIVREQKGMTEGLTLERFTQIIDDELAEAVPEVDSKRDGILQGAQSILRSTDAHDIRPEIFTGKDTALFAAALALRAHDDDAGIAQGKPGYGSSYSPHFLAISAAKLLGAQDPTDADLDKTYGEFVLPISSRELKDALKEHDVFRRPQEELGIDPDAGDGPEYLVQVLDVNGMDGHRISSGPHTEALLKEMKIPFMHRAWVERPADGIPRLYVPFGLAEKVMDYDPQAGSADRQAFNRLVVPTLEHEYYHLTGDISVGLLMLSAEEARACGRVLGIGCYSAVHNFVYNYTPILIGYELGEDLSGQGLDSDPAQLHQRMARELGLDHFLELAVMPPEPASGFDLQQILGRDLDGYEGLADRILGTLPLHKLEDVVDRVDWLKLQGCRRDIRQEEQWRQEALLRLAKARIGRV